MSKEYGYFSDGLEGYVHYMQEFERNHKIFEGNTDFDGGEDLSDMDLDDDWAEDEI